MSYLPFWAGGLLLALVPGVYWLLSKRLLGVSGLYTSIVDHLRQRGQPGAGMNEEELLAALRAETASAFGAEALGAPESAPTPVLSNNARAVFLFIGLLLGGALSAVLAGEWALGPALRGEIVTRVFSQPSGVVWPVLFLGGVLVGAGTRMAGGCTSGHGLCGVSRLQPGSLASTASFFGAGIVTALTLGALL